MRFISAFLSFFMVSSIALPQELTSSVYECHFANSLITTPSVRMKDYFDTQKGQRVGKVDLLENENVIESTPTLVFQIPLWDQQILVQIWHAQDLRVDAQLSLSGKNSVFYAVYHKGSLQQDLFCSTLSN
ncbi:cell wall hydrolase [Bdellovibrio sp. HCB337]|uniref:cell wall hydrolase n=1 Tax=Bdellovibrio sp. HCB337 TaxID=3394358 RepID=UPI0039A5A7C2